MNVKEELEFIEAKDIYKKIFFNRLNISWKKFMVNSFQNLIIYFF